MCKISAGLTESCNHIRRVSLDKTQYANAEIAEELGIPKENIILKENGDVVEFNKGKLVDKKEHIEVDQILIDGKTLIQQCITIGLGFNFKPIFDSNTLEIRTLNKLA